MVTQLLIILTIICGVWFIQEERHVVVSNMFRVDSLQLTQRGVVSHKQSQGFHLGETRPQTTS